MNKQTGAVIEREDFGSTVTFEHIKKLLKRAGPKNVTYQLAGQLASAEFALEIGYLKSDMVVFAPSLAWFGNSTDDPLFGYITQSGLISLRSLIDFVSTELYSHPYTSESDAWWSYQNALVHVLNRINAEAIVSVRY